MASNEVAPKGNEVAPKGNEAPKQEIFNLIAKHNTYFLEATNKNTFDEKYIINNTEYIKPTQDDIKQILSWVEKNGKNLIETEKNILLDWEKYIDYFQQKLGLSDGTKLILERFKVTMPLPKNEKSEDENLKSDIKKFFDSTLNFFSINGLKLYIEKVEKIKDNRDRITLINLLIGKLDKEGYRTFIQKNQLVVEKIGVKGNENNEIETILNSYINSSREGKINIEEFKISLLERTQYLDTYIVARSDTEGKILNNKVSSDDYYNFIADKYKNNNNNINLVNMGEDEIKNSPLIDEKDKSFIISYKQGAYKNFMIYNKVEEYKKRQDEIIKKTQGMEGEFKIENDNRTLPQRMGAFIKDPFSEMGKIIVNAGPFGGGALIVSMIYFLFTNPKEVLGGVAVWGLGKGTGLIDNSPNFAKKFINAMLKKFGIEPEDDESDTSKAGGAVDLIDTGNETKNYFTQKVTSNAQFVGDFKEINPGLNSYLNFINNSDFSDNTLLKDVLYPGALNKTIFSNELFLEDKLKIKIEQAGLNILYFKRVLKMYLTGKNTLVSPDGAQEHQEFENKLGITKGQNGNQLDMQDKKISEILEILKTKETQK